MSPLLLPSLLLLLLLLSLSTSAFAYVPSCSASTDILLPDVPRQEFYLRFTNPEVRRISSATTSKCEQGLKLYTAEGSDWRVTVMGSTQTQLNSVRLTKKKRWRVLSHTSRQLLTEVTMDESGTALWINVTSVRSATSSSAGPAPLLSGPSGFLTISVRCP